MKKIITSKGLAFINFTIVSYFLVIGLIYFCNIDLLLIQVFKEALTIPFLIAEIVFVYVGIRFLINNQSNLLVKISVLSLVVCAIITIWSFF
jgi:hypothetical protein